MTHFPNFVLIIENGKTTSYLIFFDVLKHGHRELKYCVEIFFLNFAKILCCDPEVALTSLTVTFN